MRMIVMMITLSKKILVNYNADDDDCDDDHFAEEDP